MAVFNKNYNTSVSNFSTTPTSYYLTNTINATTKFSNNQTQPIVLLPISGQIVLTFFYGLVVVVAVGANGLVVVLIAATRRLRTNTNMFLASQALSDALMSLICIPPNVVNNIIFNAWIFADILCPVYLYVQAVSVFLSVFTMLAICCDRYKVVLYPLKAKLSRRSTLLIIFLTWVLASLISLPIALKANVTLDTDSSNPVCEEEWENEKNRYVYTMLLLVIQYFLPVVILVFTYTRIACLVWGKKIPGEADNERDRRVEQNKKKMIRMMIVVVLIYAICWLPFHVITLSLDAYPSLYSFSHIQIVWLTCHFIAMSSLCYNPFVYFYMNSKFSDALFRSSCWRGAQQLFGNCCSRGNQNSSHSDSLFNNQQKTRFLETSRSKLSLTTCVSKILTSSVKITYQEKAENFELTPFPQKVIVNTILSNNEGQNEVENKYSFKNVKISGEKSITKEY